MFGIIIEDSEGDRWIYTGTINALKVQIEKMYSICLDNDWFDSTIYLRYDPMIKHWIILCDEEELELSMWQIAIDVYQVTEVR